LALAEQGLARRKKLGHGGKDETMYLRPLQEIAERGITPAEELLEKFNGPWNGSIEPIFDEYAY
jgi:glutamate--cysteine ligase